MRLDVFLSEHGFTVSRSEAKALIEKGAVYVAGRPMTKPSFDVTGKEETVTLDRSQKPYVSRGGIKLDGALCAFDVSVEGKDALDVGASSGGFTDCLLQHGAARVVAVDSGFGQMAQVLRDDRRVTLIEKFNARYMTAADLPFVPSLAVMDVSFISATYLLPSIYTVLASEADFICLVKPQFEVGRDGIGKGGIVKDARLRAQAVERVTECARAIGFEALGTIQSPIAGGDGNIEYLVHFRKKRG
ncbi:MAG: TlyA family RNA methyltransferase [Clostridia bacterium]|nr:TlyA family RNA methyltransferase [Clostridia bacterium]